MITPLGSSCSSTALFRAGPSLPVFRACSSSLGGVVVVGGVSMKPAACDDATEFLGDAERRRKNVGVEVERTM